MIAWSRAFVIARDRRRRPRLVLSSAITSRHSCTSGGAGRQSSRRRPGPPRPGQRAEPDHRVHAQRLTSSCSVAVVEPRRGAPRRSSRRGVRPQATAHRRAGDTGAVYRTGLRSPARPAPLAANTSVAITGRRAGSPLCRRPPRMERVLDPRPPPGQQPSATVHDVKRSSPTSAPAAAWRSCVPVTAAIAPPGVTLAWDADQPPQHISDLLSAARDPSEDTAAADLPPGSRTGITSVTAGAGLSLQACACKSVLRERTTNLTTSPGRS